MGVQDMRMSFILVFAQCRHTLQLLHWNKKRTVKLAGFDGALRSLVEAPFKKKALLRIEHQTHLLHYTLHDTYRPMQDAIAKVD